MKKRKKVILPLLFSIFFLFFSYQEISWPWDEDIDTEIQRVASLIGRYNTQMSSYLRFQIAREICWMAWMNPNLNTPLLCALITHETAGTWDPKVVSAAGAVGLMQILPPTGRGVLIASLPDSRRGDKNTALTEIQVKEVLSDPIINIRIGSRYLSSLIDRNGLNRGLIAYYMGETRMKGFLIERGKRMPLHAERYLSAVFQFYSEMS